MSSPKRSNLDQVEDDSANVRNENSDVGSPNSSVRTYSSGDNKEIICDATRCADFNAEHTVDSDDTDAQVLEHEDNWAELPSLAVEYIYSFLCRTDQSRMSQVCSRWANDFHSPLIWKTMKFYLPEHDYSSEIYPEVKFARKYSPMFRHVEIICKTVRHHLIEVIWRQLNWFLQAMQSSSQLTSIKFINMGNYFRRLDGTLHESMIKSIIRFFNTQENLKTVVFQDSRFSKEDGLELLKAIFHSDGNTIRNITLRGFVKEIPHAVTGNQYEDNLSEVSHRIAKVQSIELDYTQMFEDIIDCLDEKLSTGECQFDKQKLNLASITIFCEDKEELQFRGILPGTWKTLANAFPHMKVKMHVAIQSELNREMEKFLVREMPLYTLNFRFEKSSSRIDLSTLFSHLQICMYNYYLVDLRIVWMASVGDFEGSVVSFIQSCKKSTNFHLYFDCDPSEMESIHQFFAKSPGDWHLEIRNN